MYTEDQIKELFNLRPHFQGVMQKYIQIKTKCLIQLKYLRQKETEEQKRQHELIEELVEVENELADLFINYGRNFSSLNLLRDYFQTAFDRGPRYFKVYCQTFVEGAWYFVVGEILMRMGESQIYVTDF